MRLMTAGIIFLGALATASAGGAQELVTSGERAAAPATSAPKPLAPPEQQARDEANARWAQNILDGKPNPADDEEERLAQGGACLPADTKPFGEVRVAVGTGGYKSTGFTMVKPLKGCGEIAVSADWSDGGRGFRRR